MARLALAQHGLLATFAYRDGHPVSTISFLREVSALASALPDRRYVINLCVDRYRFTVGFAAALMRGQTTLMPPNQTLDCTARLEQRYTDIYRLSETDFGGLPNVDSPGAMPMVPAGHPAAILFTSGSTGEPQPHVKTWGALVKSARAQLERFSGLLLPGTALLATVPAQHMYGLESTVLVALQGALAMHARRAFFPADICATLADLPRPRALVTTPVHLRAMLDGSTELPAADFLLCATAPLAPRLAAEAEARFGGPLYEIYGCTEAGQIATRRTVAGLEWHMYPHFGLRQDERGTWVHGGHVADELLLGDVIQLTQKGFLLHGRTGDLVNIAGKRASLSHLNYHLNSIDGVRDGTFVVQREASAGAVARLAAFVVAPGCSEEMILQALRKRIDTAFLPRPLHLVDALPRNEVGKLPRVGIDALTEQMTAKAR